MLPIRMDVIESAIPKHARISEIAKLAGVGTATVDRVLNGRGNVKPETKQRVLQAKHAIETGAQLNARARPWRLRVFLPEEAGPSTEFLGKCFQNVYTNGRATIDCIFSKKLEPAVLARKLRACAGQGVDAVGFQALDDPRVRHAVDELDGLGIPCIPVVSGLVSPTMGPFIGTDNMAAGRTAAYVMGRMVPRSGPVALICGGTLYRIHMDREMGFRTILRNDFPHLTVVGTYSGDDNAALNRKVVHNILDDYPELAGIYNVGAGNAGIVTALKEREMCGKVMLIGHNLTPRTAAYLLEGAMDIVIHQNMQRIADLAVRTLIARLENRPTQVEMVPVEVITRENITGATFG